MSEKTQKKNNKAPAKTDRPAKARPVAKAKASTSKTTTTAVDETTPGYHVVETRSGHFYTTLNRMYVNRKPWQPRNPKHILSFMPGTIEEVKVKKGDKVSEGDSLMIFRAMKMNNNIVAPMDGKIKAVNVKKGENIPKNTVMIEIE